MKQLTPFLIVIVCVAMYFMYISPQLEKISLKSAKYEEYKNIIDKVNEIKTLRDELTLKYSSISPQDKDKLNKIIPEKFDPVLFVNDMNILASRHSLKMDSIIVDSTNSGGRVSETQPTDALYNEVSSTFHLVGDNAKFLMFLKELESSLRLIDVISLTIRPGNSVSTGVGASARNNNSNLDYTLSVKTYYLK